MNKKHLDYYNRWQASYPERNLEEPEFILMRTSRILTGQQGRDCVLMITNPSLFNTNLAPRILITFW